MTDDTGLALTDETPTEDARRLAGHSPAEDDGLHLRPLREWLLDRTSSPTLGAPVSLLVGGAVVAGVAVHPVTAARLAAEQQSGGESGRAFFEAAAEGHELDAVDAAAHQVDTVHLANATVGGVTLPVLTVAVSRVDAWSPVAEASLDGIWDTHGVRDQDAS